MSSITLNIVEPDSTPIEPVVPDTGLFTHGIGGPEATILGITAAVIILAVIVAVLYYRNKKQGKSISLKHKKSTAIGLASLAAVVSLGTVAGLLKLGTSATDDSLTVTSSSEELTIELDDEPVFAVLPVELTVAEATEAGYTLTAYAESTGLVSTTNSSDIIPMVTVEENELVALADNTYGLALVEPESQEDEVYAALSTDADTPTLITDKDYKATEENDTTIIYYGFYITPDVSYGTYTGTTINYQANPNYITNLSFDGNGSDGGTAIEGMTILAGDTITLPQNTYTKEGYSFTGWNTQADGEGKAYADEAEFTASLTESEDITLYAQWEKIVYLYDNVKALVKRSNGAELTQSVEDLKAVITVPTSSDPSIDTSNSGVYKYDSLVFGFASDASNEYDIYYYRGILDSNLDPTSGLSYGSKGDGAYYPNYVLLGDTCWRIVRTTGSGGVKMIYNGSYSGGDMGNSCANTALDARLTTSVYNGDSSTSKQLVRVGYTYNDTYATNVAQTAKISQVFGSDEEPSGNNADSTIKDYIENTWFSGTEGISVYENLLEPSAGYCGDRTVYNDVAPYIRLDETTTDVITYDTSVHFHFGGGIRNLVANGTRALTLGCDRSKVDLYTASNAANGNKQLLHPVALLTADEVALAGSGGGGGDSGANYSSNYSYSSYLTSGGLFWLLSPNGQYSYGGGGEFVMTLGSNLSSGRIDNEFGVRPAISLKHDIRTTSGSGTATDPWVVNE